MSILLTGGTGYIGSHTAVVLAAAGHEIVLYDNLSNSSASVVDRLAKIIGRRPVFVRGDIRDTEHLVRTMKAHQVKQVVHFAGLKAVGESVQKPLEYYDNNVAGTVSLLKAMAMASVQTLVFSSSATVYGDPEYLPIDESHPTRATNPYGRTKLQIEEILWDVAKSDSAWWIACLRYFNPVGAHESGLIGEDPQGIPNNLMPYIARVAAGQLDELAVFGNDYPTSDGTGVRDYIHVMDLAEGHQAALDHLSKHDEAGKPFIWNLGTGQGYSVLEIVKAFEAANGKFIPHRIAPRRRGDIAACYAQTDKALRELGWRATRSLADMCASTWHFQQTAKK